MPPNHRETSVFDKHAATLDELAGVGRNLRFDAIVDDEADDRIEVVCRRLNTSGAGDQDKYIEVPLAKPSRAFYFGDRNLYEQEAKRYGGDEKQRILSTNEFTDNGKVF